MTLLESAIERRVVKDAKKLLGIAFAIKLELRNDTGFPDRMFCPPGGKVVFIEFKRPGEKPSPKQAYRLSQLARLGYDAVWFDNYADAMDHLANSVVRP